ncbi:MAG: PAS domain S-box protein [Desulfobacterales bacterium]|nr:PAS domain S-box protein [Desulfobacterales bacterium]
MEYKRAFLYARSLIEVSLDPLVTISPEGKIMDVNESTELITGISRKELIGSNFSNYFTEPEKAEEGYKLVFEKGIVRDYLCPSEMFPVRLLTYYTMPPYIRTRPEKCRVFLQRPVMSRS